MWKWSCPKSPKLEWEHHTLKDLDISLTYHERGLNVPGGFKIEGFRSFPACDEIHDYWDDGVPCDVRNCTFRYIPEDVV